MAKYAIQIKPSARRELENLSDRLIARLMPKMEQGKAFWSRGACVEESEGYFFARSFRSVFSLRPAREPPSRRGRGRRRRDTKEFLRLLKIIIRFSSSGPKRFRSPAINHRRANYATGDVDGNACRNSNHDSRRGDSKRVDGSNNIRTRDYSSRRCNSRTRNNTQVHRK